MHGINRSVRLNCLVGRFLLAILKRHHHERNIKLFSGVLTTFSSEKKQFVDFFAPRKSQKSVREWKGRREGLWG